MLLDVLLPGRNGLEALAELRCRRSVPVILMSALGAEQDRIAGFSQGADDYLPKPFAMAELEVRIAAILRRVAYQRRRHEPAVDGGLRFDESRGDVCHEGQWAQLTLTEFRLLELLAAHPGEVLEQGLPLSAGIAPPVLGPRPRARHARQPHPPQAAGHRLSGRAPGDGVGTRLPVQRRGSLSAVPTFAVLAPGGAAGGLLPADGLAGVVLGR